MEMTDELKVLVTAEVDKAVKNLGELDKKTNETENSFRKLGEVLASAALTKAVVSFGQESVQAAEEASRSMRLLASTVEATGAGAWTSADALHKMAVEFRDLSGIDNGKIESMQTVLLGFKNITGATFKKATGAILDMATVMNMDLSSAAQAVGKALDDPINGLDSLRRQGFAFTEAQKEVIKALIESGETAEAQEIILKELEGTYGGAAKAANNAFSQLQNAFGELKETVGNHIQPLVSGVAEGILDLIERFDGLDAGTQRMILAAGGLVAALPGVTLAIKGVSAALTTLAANPIILGITGVAAAVGLIAGAAYNAAHAEEDLRKELIETKNSADALLDSFGGLDGEKKLDARSTAELIALYPELSTEIKAYATSVDEAREAVRKLTAQELENSLQKQINKLIDWQGKIETLNELLDEKNKNLNADLNGENAGEYSDNEDWQALNATIDTNLLEGIKKTEQDIGKLENKISTSVASINEQLATVGKTLDRSTFKIVDLIAEPQKVEEEIEKAVEPVEKAVVKTKKTWQEWFKDVTGTSAAGESGQKAGEAYADGFSGVFSNNKTLAGMLGENFHARDELKAEAEKIKSDIERLLSIDPVEIDDPFTLDDDSIKVMAAKYKDLMTRVLDPKLFDDEKIKWQEFLGETLNVDPAEFGKDGKKAVELYVEGMREELENAENLSEMLGDKFDVVSFYEKQRDEIRDKIEELLGAGNLDQAFTSENEVVQELAENYRMLSQTIDDLSESEVQLISWEDALTDSLERGLEKLGVFSAEARQIIAELGTSLASVSFDSVLSGLSTFGEAIGNGKDATDSMREAMASMAQQILDSLPTMFLQAGLQLIAQGQWALGLGFVAAGGASSFISGFVSGRTSGDAEKNALGGVYGDEFYAAFAKGGTFTNGIVTSPTYFKFARGGGFGTGLMGEAGPEAIMPLTRGADGSLGVTASGLGMCLQVVINNYGSEEVRAEETTGENGQRQLEITIGTLINRHISGGMADKAMSSRFGIKAKGV
ncbi:MAG: phage tail length tape measure family protein [Treponema sp.]|nr:phage tail length tape measure family protein [Treponema sp.]